MLASEPEAAVGLVAAPISAARCFAGASGDAGAACFAGAAAKWPSSAGGAVAPVGSWSPPDTQPCSAARPASWNRAGDALAGCLSFRLFFDAAARQG